MCKRRLQIEFINLLIGHTSLVEFLLLKGFRPNARDRTLKTPLHIAAFYG